MEPEAPEPEAAEPEVFLTSDLARAARALTKVSAQVIADSSGLTRKQVRDFEKGKSLGKGKKARLREALERNGALFVPEDGVAGYGVRRILSHERFMKLNIWEGEGGSLS